MLTWLVVLALLWPLFWCLRLLLVTRALMGLQWRRTDAEALAWESLPPHVCEATSPWIARLEAVGFRLRGGMKLCVTTEQALDELVVVLDHATQPIRAIVGFKSEAAFAGECMVALCSTAADGSEYITRNYEPETLLPLSPGIDAETVATPVMEELLQRHLARMAGAQSAWWRCPDIASAARREVQVQNAILEHACRAGLLIEEPSGAFRYTASSAVRRAAVVLRAEKKKKGAPAFSTPGIPELTASTLTEFDLQHYRQLSALQRGKFSLRAKAVLGAVSFAAFAAVLAWQYSLAVAATLVVALVFHEGGHLLAMRLFGFRDLQLLFIPFFGGAAVGMDDRVLRPWQHVVIILAGPLPGIFVALGMFAYGSGAEMPPWFNEAAMTALVLNAFNLLPVLPLDGGQIVDYAVASRFPRARVLFVTVSALGMLLLGTVLGGVKLLIGVGIATLLRLPTEWRLAAIKRAVRSEFPEGGDEEPVVRSVLAHLRGSEWAKTPISHRLNFVRGLQNTLRMRRPGFGTIGLAALGYTAPLWLGLPLLVWASIRKDELRAERAEARAIAAGFVRETDRVAPTRRLAESDNAAVLIAQATALNAKRGPKAAARGFTDPEVIALLREAARKPGYAPLLSMAKEAEGEEIFGGNDAICANLLCLEAEQRLRYREMAEAADIAVDALRLYHLLQAAPERLEWSMHLHTNARAWQVIEEALAAGITFSPETAVELRRLADEDELLGVAARVIPDGLWRQAQLLGKNSGARQGYWLGLLLRIQGSSYSMGGYREQLIDEALLARDAFKMIPTGRWPARARGDGAAAAFDRELLLLSSHVARLRLARVALTAMDIQRRGGVVTSLESLGISLVQLEHPFTKQPARWSRRGAFWVIDYDGESGGGEFEDSEVSVPLTWRIPAGGLAARK